MLINDLSAHVLGHQAKLKAAVGDVIDSGWLVLGPKVKQFEQAFAAYLGSTFCVSLANGTDAIELALKALGVCPGDRVATVANAGMYSSMAVLAIGAEPIFMDVDIDSRNASLGEVARAIDAGAKVVIVTHLYGLAVPQIQEIAELCEANGVKLLEDCAQAHGAFVAGRRVGTFGDAASFSFYPTKNLGALGDGGAVVTNDSNVAESVARLRQYGWTSKYRVEMAGGRNSRLDEMQAAILLVFLPHLDSSNARRRAIATTYSQEIRNHKISVPGPYKDEYVGHLYVIRTDRRDALRMHLHAHDVSSDIHYPVPDHRQPVFGDRFSEICLPCTERLSGEVLTLPCYPEMTQAQVAQVIDAVNAWK